MPTTLRRGESGPPVEVLIPGDIIDIDVADLAPGLPGDVITTWFDGVANRSRWLNGTGNAAVQLLPYLERDDIAGNVADAIAAALEENPNAECLILPAGDLELDRTIGNFSGGDGLRSNLTFIGVPGSTRFVRNGTFTPFFAFPQSSSDVTFNGVGFYLDNPSNFGIAVQAYDTTRFNFFQCSVVCPTAPSQTGAAISIAMLGSVDCTVTNCYFEHAQCGFGGLGYGCDGVVFANNHGENCDDFLCSVVTGIPEETNLDIKNVVIAHNTVRGINGSGAFFVGSDGGNNPADLVEGVLIQGNTMIGTPEASNVGVRNYIIFFGGIVTHGVDILDNIILDSSASTIAQYGILGSSVPGSTVFADINISRNYVGKMGANGVKAIHLDSPIINDSKVEDNICRLNRGIHISNPVRVKVAGNQIFEATSLALQIVANSRNITELEIFDNYIEATGAFQAALHITTSGSFTVAASIEKNKLFSTSSSAFSYVPNAGSGAFDWYNNTILNGGIDAAALAAIKNARPAFIPAGGTNYTFAAPLALTLLPIGHKPGLYLIGQDVILRTVATGGTLRKSITYSAPTIGAVSFGPNNLTALSTTLVTLGHIGDIAALGGTGGTAGGLGFLIYSDGSAAIILTFTPTAVTGSPVADVYASATLVGVLAP